jgi:hypothetical protein
MRVRWRWLVVFLITGLSAVLVVIRAYTYFDESLNRGLEEEKSYTRHAMEYHRTHPDKRQGDTVLEAWADADYIAHIVQQRRSSGEWAEWSDKLPYLPDDLRFGHGRPYCVIRFLKEIVVIRFGSAAPENCNTTSAGDASLTSIRSGDLEFSGRTDWVYLLRTQN